MPKPKFSLVFALAAARASVALLDPSHVIILSRDRVKHHPRRPQRLGGMEDRDNAWSSSGGSSDRRGEDAEEVSVVEITGSHEGPAVEKPFNWESMASNDNYVWYLKDWYKNKYDVVDLDEKYARKSLEEILKGSGMLLLVFFVAYSAGRGSNVKEKIVNKEIKLNKRITFQNDSIVAVKFIGLFAKKSSISTSTIGDFLLLSNFIFSSTISTAITSLCCANNIAFERPT